MTPNLSKIEAQPGCAAPVRVRLKDFAAAKPESYPGLKRAMAVTVERPWEWSNFLPWRWGRLFWATIAWRIRANTGGRASHFMIYAGGGQCLSQDIKYGAVHLKKYRGCILRFLDPSHWTQEMRNKLVADATVRFGAGYSFQGILGQLLEAKTGDESWPEKLDEEDDYCSEAGCEQYRDQEPTYGGKGSCQKDPDELEAWMIDQGWPCLAIYLV